MSEKVQIEEDSSDKELSTTISDKDTRNIRRELMIPDRDEIYLFLVGILIVETIIRPLIGVSYFSRVLIPFLGLINLGLYSLRWGYTSIAHFVAREENILRRMNKGEINHLDCNLFGLLSSIFLLYFGFLFVV